MLHTLTSWWNTDATPFILGLLVLMATIGTAWLVVVSLVARLVRRSAAETRAALWAVGMIGLLLLPIGRVILPPVTIPTTSGVWLALHTVAPAVDPVSSGRSVNTRAAQPRGASSDATVHVTSTPGPDARDLTVTVNAAPSTTAVAAGSASDDGWRVTTIVIVAVWLLGALTMTIRFIRGTRQARRLSRSASRSFDGPQWALMQEVCEAVGVHRPVSLRLVDGAQIPMTVGIIHPEVLLPASSLTWHTDRLRMVLQHELGHIARYDLALATLAQIVVIGCWWHPLVWYAMREMEREREHACDDVVLRCGVAPVRYADELLSVVRELRTPTPSAFATLAMARSSDIEQRLKALLNPSAPRHRLSRASSATMVAAAALLLPLGHLVPVRATARTLPSSSAIAAAAAADAAVAAAVAAKADSSNDDDGNVLELGKPCEAVKSGSSSITRSRTDDAIDDYTRSDHTGCLRVSRRGRVSLPTDASPVVVDDRGRLLAEQAVGRDIRRVVISRRNNQLSRVVTHNGAPIAEGPAPAWVQALLLSAYRETGLGAEERVSRILSAQGVGALLAEIELIRSDETRVRYYELGLRAETLPTADRARLAQAATAFVARVGSRGDRARIDAAIQRRHTP